MTQPLRRRAVTKVIPMEIAVPLRGRRQLRQHGHGLLQPTPLGEQLRKRRRPLGQTGRQLPTNS